MQRDYPYAAEYAKSNRSSCRTCSSTISKDSLRLAVMVQSPKFDGKVPQWHHFSCFFKKHSIKSSDNVKNFDQLRWDDQENINKKIEKACSECDSKVEYSKSNRATCMECKKQIDKGVIRISTKEDSVEVAVGPIDRWHHLDCFISKKNEILEKCGNTLDIEKLEGFSNVSEEDKQLLIKKFKGWKQRKRANPKEESTEEPDPKKKKIEDKNKGKLKEQSNLIWKVRDEIEKCDISKNGLQSLLEHNKQYTPRGEHDLLNCVAECLVFGALEPCPECGGDLQYNNGEYVCKSMVNEWVKCGFVSNEATKQVVCRREFKIPDYIKEEIDYLKKYKYVARTRVLPPKVNYEQEINTVSKSTNNHSTFHGYVVTIDNGPFPNTSKKSLSKRMVEDKVADCRGRHAELIDATVLCHIAKQETITEYLAKKKNTKKFEKIAKCEEHNVDVVTIDIFDVLKSSSVEDAVKQCSKVQWGRTRDEIKDLKNAKDESESIPNKQKYTVKGGSAVDPESNLADKYHIYQDPKANSVYNAILGMVDIVRGTNSFYKIQLLASDKKNKYYVYRSWGRIGTTIGGNIKDLFTNIEKAKESFKNFYFEKTDNLWDERHNFKKKPYKYYPIDVVYGDDDDEGNNENKQESDVESKLPVVVQSLIKFIFDIASMKRTIKEFEIDLAKMPLGKLSKKQIAQAYQALKDLQTVLEENFPEISKDPEVSKTSVKNRIIELSTKFYTLMPHNFGMKAPPLIKDTSMIKQKCELLDNLMEIEVAYTLMNQNKGDNNNNAEEVCEIDRHYMTLHNRIVPIDETDVRFQRIKRYLKNTRGSTHRKYELQIRNVYDVEREFEKERFAPFNTKESNRVMLWHGSRRTNWAGILSQGLRIAPPEAPVTGYMFGKGIYFADSVTKSANYCFTSRSSPVGLFLLCEVALGECAQRKSADTSFKLKPGENSCHGIGHYRPDSTFDEFDEDGIKYPLGKLKHHDDQGLALMYNEFIVYDIAQVRQRYLVEAFFKY